MMRAKILEEYAQHIKLNFKEEMVIEVHFTDVQNE